MNRRTLNECPRKMFKNKYECRKVQDVIFKYMSTYEAKFLFHLNFGSQICLNTERINQLILDLVNFPQNPTIIDLLHLLMDLMVLPIMEFLIQLKLGQTTVSKNSRKAQFCRTENTFSKV